MKHVDIGIIGAGRIGRWMASQLAKKQRSVVLVSLPGDPEDYLYKTVSLISNQPGSVDSDKAEDSRISIVKGPGQFTKKHTFETSQEAFIAKRFILASGSVPRPREEGLFPLDVLSAPISGKSFSILGAGPIGVGIAQALRKKGASVQLYSKHDQILPHEEPEIPALLRTRLKESGVEILPSNAWKQDPNTIVATGFMANTRNLGLEKVGVYINPEGQVVTLADMKTSCPWIWAAGVVTGPRISLALENQQAEIASNNVVAPFFSKLMLDNEHTPITLPTDPLIARIGLMENEARKIHDDVKTHIHYFGPQKNSMIKIIGRKKGARVLGVSILGDQSAEMILFFDLVMRADISLADLTDQRHSPILTSAAAAYESVWEWLSSHSEAHN